MEEFAVIQTRFEVIPFEVLVQVLVTQGEMPRADACRTARRQRGILGDHFNRSQADAICKQMTELDFGACVVPSADLPELPEPRTIRWFVLDQQSLQIPAGIHGQTVPMDWSSVFVINVGQIAQVKKTVTRERRPMASRYEKYMVLTGEDGTSHRTSGNLIDVIDIIGLDRSGDIRYLRMPSTEIAYGRIMGEGTTLNRFERFLVIVEYLVAQATQAIVSMETRKILANREPHSRTVEGDAVEQLYEDSMRNYNSWLLHLAIRRERELEEP